MERYRIHPEAAVYFLTYSIVEWLPVFIREATCKIVVDRSWRRYWHGLPIECKMRRTRSLSVDVEGTGRWWRRRGRQKVRHKASKTRHAWKTEMIPWCSDYQSLGMGKPSFGLQARYQV